MNHFMNADGGSLCGSPSLNRTTDREDVDCQECKRKMEPKRRAGHKLTHYAPVIDNVTACGKPANIYPSDEWGTADALMVTCPECIGALTLAKCAEPVICSVKEEDRPAFDAAVAHAVSGQRRLVVLPEGMEATQNPLYIRVGNVEIIGQPGKNDPRGIPAMFRIFVNGKPVACRNVSIEGGVDRFWQVRLDFLPAEEKGGA